MVAVWLAVARRAPWRSTHAAVARGADRHRQQAEIGLALCDNRIADELVAAAEGVSPERDHFDGTSNHDES
jgi:hypothetical protein